MNDQDGKSNYPAIRVASNSNTLESNIISDNGGAGIYVMEASNNTITANDVRGNHYGIYLSSSPNNHLLNNFIISNYTYGIHIRNSPGNILTGNNMTGWGITISGDSLNYWNTLDIADTNTINGKTVYFYKDQDGGIVPTDAGQVILANCRYMLIEGQNISATSIGIQIGFSSGVIVSDNLCNENNQGIITLRCQNITIINNTCNGNINDGISLQYSDENHVFNNTCNYNWRAGIILYRSESNIVMENNCSIYNDAGIMLLYAGNNTISRNICRDNMNHAVHLEGANSNLLEDNICTNGSSGISLNNSFGNRILRNFCSNSTNGMEIFNSVNNSIINNSFKNNREYGISFDENSEENDISHNRFESNGKGDTNIKEETDEDDIKPEIVPFCLIFIFSIIAAAILIFIGIKVGKKILKYFIPIYILGLIIIYPLFFIIFLTGEKPPFPGLNIVGFLVFYHIIIGILGIALQISMIVDCAKRKFDKEYKKIIWIVLMIQFSFLAAIIYYYVHGRKPIELVLRLKSN